MTQEQWTAVDDYITDLLVRPDAALQAALDESIKAGLPPHHVSPAQGKLLQLLVRMRRAQNILEIGTLGGYSTIWLARGLSTGGRVVTLESNAGHAEVARTNIARAELAEVVEIRVGPALDTLPQLAAEKSGPFDFIFIDADKSNNEPYLSSALRLSATGTVIIADNVVRSGAVVHEASSDPSVMGARRLMEALAAEHRVIATALQTVGAKGHDGFVLALVL
jgi:predicted O-methyltransferase YrrM